MDVPKSPYPWRRKNQRMLRQSQPRTLRGGDHRWWRACSPWSRIFPCLLTQIFHASPSTLIPSFSKFYPLSTASINIHLSIFNFSPFPLIFLPFLSPFFQLNSKSPPNFSFLLFFLSHSSLSITHISDTLTSPSLLQFFIFSFIIFPIIFSLHQSFHFPFVSCVSS